MTKLEKSLELLSIECNDKIIDNFNKYYEMLIKWNSFMNLTRIVDYDEVVVKHFIDSLSLVHVIPEIKENPHWKVLDMGTGAGMPGIPLKIAFDHIDIVLMDSLMKRVNFLDNVINELLLDKISAVHMRAEEAGRKREYREAFDICVSRAVAKMSLLIEYCLPFVKVGGYFAAYKSVKSDDEINDAGEAVKLLGGEIISKVKFLLPDSDIERVIILVKKVKNSPMIYPRQNVNRLKNPL